MEKRRKGKIKFYTAIVNNKDTNNGLETLIKIAQYHSFPLEMSNLLSLKSINYNDKILSLSPFIDEKDVIRVGKRLKNTNVNPDAKHQVIL